MGFLTFRFRFMQSLGRECYPDLVSKFIGFDLVQMGFNERFNKPWIQLEIIIGGGSALQIGRASCRERV